MVLLAVDDSIFDAFLAPRTLSRLASRATIVRAGAKDWTTHPDVGRARVVVTGWGSAALDAEVLERAPELMALVHTGGTVKSIVKPEVWKRRGFAVSSQVEANAAPVAAHTASVIVLALRGTWDLREQYRQGRGAFYASRQRITDRSRGMVNRTVGIVSASRIGREVIELLRPWPVSLVVYDPYLSQADAEALGATWVESLVELASRSDVLSIHTPLLPETVGLIDAEVLAALPDHSVVVNTSRGAIIDEPALVAELVSGRLSAVLDVTNPEPPVDDSPLWHLDNVFLTPHVAGSLGTELEVLGSQAVDEAIRVLLGEPLLHEVDPQTLANQA